MKSSSLSVEFSVNDLSSNYEIIGTSDNYSFQYNLGKGSDLVDIVGDSASKIIPLKGNYGNFEIKIFAVSDIGVRSQFLFGEINVSPPSFGSTFTFNNLRISSSEENIQESLVHEYSPAEEGDKLIVSQQFQGKNIELTWDLIPPKGHALEGQSVNTELLSDSLFSGIIVDIKTGDQVIDLSNIDVSNDAIQSLSSYLNTAAENVSDELDNYRNFSLVLDESVFDGLNLPREVGIDLIAVDKFGKTCTGTITGSNPEPFLSNVISNLNGSDMSFSWAVDTADYSGMDINVLGIPQERHLFDSGDLLASKTFFDDINYTISNNIIWNNGFNYNSGDLVLEDGNVYRSNSDHVAEYSTRPSSDPEVWENYGDSVDYVFVQQETSELVFNQEQFFGYKYYYTFKIFDSFGPGELMLLGENESLLPDSDEDAVLFPYKSEIKIANLRFHEREDDLIFNWEIVDQDENAVDLIQYRAAFKEGGLPSILGLSGSLYDVDSNQKITGLTEGNNSISLTKNEDGNTEVVYGLQTSKIFDTFEYTREINNKIYGTGGFPKIYETFDYTKDYDVGDIVTSESNVVYKAISDTSLDDPAIKPFYDIWEKQNSYSSGESFEYGEKIYKVNEDFGPKYTLGLFDFYTTYNSGDLVVAPSQYFENFNSGNEYNIADLVVYNATLYKCLEYQESGEAVTPGSDPSKWRIASLFSEVDCNVYEALDQSQGLIPINTSIEGDGDIVYKWRVCNPENSTQVVEYIENYPNIIPEWDSSIDFTSGTLTLHQNDIWSGINDSGPNQELGSIVPGSNDSFWVNLSNEQDIIFNYDQGDIVYSQGFVYKAAVDNPVGAPLMAIDEVVDNSNSSYNGTQWIPYWQEESKYQDKIFGHIGIPQSGKRSVGIELAIVDREGDIFDLQKLSADNPAPYILRDGFSVDSTSEATKVKFNFNYALGFQEKTTKVYLYRSEDPVFDIVDEDGFPITGGAPFVKSVLGAGDATLGQNITEIIDSPDIYVDENGIEQITGYYYKILPFDDFGSGVLYEATNNAGILEQVLVYPSRYNNSNPNVMPGRVLRADPTAAAGAVPGPILGLSGSTAFENFFLNWRAPGSEYEQGSTLLLKQQQNDIDHYEVWASDENILYTGDSQGNYGPWEQSQNTGYRKIDGVMYNVLPSGRSIPTEAIDPALNISGATNIFNISASSPSLETVYPGETNETKSFWVRAVDFAGNKSPFTGRALDVGDDILGLSLTLGQATATDISDFEINMTEKFGNSIALVPSNPFSSNSPSAKNVSWIDHVLYYQGTGYFIDAGSTNSGYVWWDVDELPNQGNYEYGNLNNIYYSGVYKLSDAHPQGGYDSNNNYISENPEFEDTDFIIARNSNGIVSPVYYSFPNALIGTANIAEAAIISAKINDLSADKITSAEISSADIRISSKESSAGVIRSAGFTGIDYTDPNLSGFYLSGDGTFAFQDGTSSLGFDNGDLTLRGRIKQTDSSDYDFIEIDASPVNFNYVETDQGFVYQDVDELSTIDLTFRNSSITDKDEIQIKAFGVSGDGSQYSIGNISSQWRPLSTVESAFDFNYPNDAEKFKYKPDSFSSSSLISSAQLTLTVEAFDAVVKADDGGGESMVIYAKSSYSNLQKKINIGRIIDGPVGESVNIIFKRSADPPTKPDPSETAPESEGWFDNDPGGQGLLWASNGTTSIGGGNYIWQEPFQVEGQAIAEVYIYRKGNSNPPSGGSYDFTQNILSPPADWSINPPDLENNGDIIYVVVGLAAGSSTDQSASIAWQGTPAVYAQRTDGQKGDEGRSPVYQGVWEIGEEYYGSAERGDIVKYGGLYYLCISTHTSDNVSTGQGKHIFVDEALNDTYWKPFGASFSSVATKLLITENSFVTDTITIGDATTGGKITSNNFIGGFDLEGKNKTLNPSHTENYNPGGFRIERLGTAGALFDVGGLSPNDTPSYIRFSTQTQKFEIRGGTTNNSSDENIDWAALSLADTISATPLDPQATFIGGGYNNTFSSADTNLASSIVAGAGNNIKGRYSFIGNGVRNDCRDNFSAIVAGYNNSMPKDDAENEGANFIGAGQNNTINGGTNQAIICGSNNTINYNL